MNSYQDSDEENYQKAELEHFSEHYGRHHRRHHRGYYHRYYGYMNEILTVRFILIIFALFILFSVILAIVSSKN